MADSQMSATDVHVSILDLPDEILDDIFFQFIQVSYYSFCPIRSWYDDSEVDVRSANLYSLALVCRRFNSIATPRLYTVIDFEPPRASFPRGWYHNASLLQLRTLMENPLLASYSRVLNIRYTWDGIYHCNEANQHFMNLVSLCTQTTSLTLGDGFCPRNHNDYIFKLLDSALRNMPKLRSLTLGNLGVDFLQPDIAAACLRRLSSHQSLRKLRVQNMHDESWEVLSSQLKDLEGTAHFTELEVVGSDIVEEGLRRLCLWPAQLKKVLIERQTCYREAPLAPILDHHKESLTSITIRHSGNTSLEHLDFSEYRRLRELRLSALSVWGYSKIHLMRPQSFAALAAPNLDVFYWDFTLPGRWGCLPFGFFSSPQEDWLRTFVHAVKSNKSPLRQIQICFEVNAPTLWSHHCLADAQTADGSTPYPWDYLDAIAIDFRKMGIELIYPEPDMTKDQFLELTRRLKRDPLNRPFSSVIPTSVVW